jgi:hypothetical protein
MDLFSSRDYFGDSFNLFCFASLDEQRDGRDKALNCCE